MSIRKKVMLAIVLAVILAIAGVSVAEVRSITTASEEQSATTVELTRGTEQVKSLSDAVAELVELSRRLDTLVETLHKG